jgi:hypothetical protein
MLLTCKDVDAKKGPEAGITPSRVARDFGHEYIFDLLSGYEDKTQEMACKDKGPFEDTKDQGGETQWDGNLKQNLDRSAVKLPVENNIPSTRIITSVSKAKKMSSILSSN